MPYDHEKVETNATSLLPWFLEIETFCLPVSQNFPVYPYEQTQVKLFIPSWQVPLFLQVTLIQSSMSESNHTVTHKTLAQLKKLGWVGNTLVNDVKTCGIIWTGNNLEGDQLAFNNEKKAADLTIVLIDCFRISIIQSLYHPLFSPRSIWKQQYWSLSALQHVVTEHPIEPRRGLGDIFVVNSSIFWLAWKWRVN